MVGRSPPPPSPPRRWWPLVLIIAISLIAGVAFVIVQRPSDAERSAAQHIKAQEERVVANATTQLMDKVTSGEAVIATVSESDGTGKMKQKTVIMSKADMVTVRFSDGGADDLDPTSAYHIAKMHGPDKVSNFAEVMAHPGVRRVKLTYEAEVFAEAERQRAISDASLEGLKHVVGTPVSEVPAWTPAPAEAAPEPAPVAVPQAPRVGRPDAPVDVVIDGRVKRGPPVIPDPVGLGERLVLIDVLVEQFQIPRRGLVLEGVTFDDLVAIYWRAVQKSGKPSPYPERDAPAQATPPPSAVFHDDTPVPPREPLTAEQLAAYEAERNGPAPGEVIIRGRGTHGRPQVVREEPRVERAEPEARPMSPVPPDIAEPEAPAAAPAPVPVAPAPAAPAREAPSAVAAPVNIPRDLQGTYQVRSATIRGKREELRSPQELLVLGADSLSLQWDGVAVGGTITACTIKDGLRGAKIVALSIKGDTGAYRVHFTFAGSEFSSEVKIVVEDLAKRAVIGTWTEGRRK